ncbi:Amidohydrolase [compost metagenome]
MRYAAAGCHPAHIARQHALIRAQAVLVQDCAFEQVGQGRQADMRVLANIHAMARRIVSFEHVVEEHERADAAALRRRQWAQDRLALDRLGARADHQWAAHAVLQAAENSISIAVCRARLNRWLGRQVYSVHTQRRMLPMIARALACLLLGATLCQAAQARDYRYSDAHLHYVDFFQETEGMTALVKAMDEAGVDHSMISGIPVAKKWHEDEPKRPRYYAGDDADAYWYSATDTYVAAALQKLPAEQRKRFHPFLTGFNPVDKNAVSHIERMLDLYPGLWQGIGEVFTRHDDLTALTSGDTPRANNEAMTRIYHLAAERDMPVLLHSNITSKRERNPLYLAEIEEPLRNHPHTRFIWAHAGTSMEIHRHQTQMDFLLPVLTRLLNDYPNLYIDLSWTVLKPYLLDDKGMPRKEWLALVERFPQRFMLGSDVVGKFGSVGEQMHGFKPFLDGLPEGVAKQVARDNFLAVLPKAR